MEVRRRGCVQDKAVSGQRVAGSGQWETLQPLVCREALCPYPKTWTQLKGVEPQKDSEGHSGHRTGDQGCGAAATPGQKGSLGSRRGHRAARRGPRKFPGNDNNPSSGQQGQKRTRCSFAFILLSDAAPWEGVPTLQVSPGITAQYSDSCGAGPAVGRSRHFAQPGWQLCLSGSRVQLVQGKQAINKQVRKPSTENRGWRCRPEASGERHHCPALRCHLRAPRSPLQVRPEAFPGTTRPTEGEPWGWTPELRVQSDFQTELSSV